MIRKLLVIFMAIGVFGLIAFAGQQGPVSDRAYAASLNPSGEPEGTGSIYSSNNSVLNGDFKYRVQVEVWFNPTTRIYTYFYKVRPGAPATGGGYITIFGDSSGMVELNFGWIPSENEGGTFVPCAGRTTPFSDAKVFVPPQYFSFNVSADTGEAMTLYFQSYLKPSLVKAQGLAREYAENCNPTVDRYDQGKVIAPLPKTKGKR